MDILTQTLQEHWDTLLRLTPRIAIALIVLAFGAAIGGAIGAGVARLLRRGESTARYDRVVRVLVRLAVLLLSLTIALEVLGLGRAATSILAAGGVTAVVLGFAFQAIGENLLAGLFLSFARPFEVRDTVEIGGLTGQVKDLGMRQIHLRTPDGSDIFVPCIEAFRSPVRNYTRDGLRRPSFVVGIDYADDTSRAREILLDTVRETEGVLAEPAASVQVQAFGSNYVELVVSFWLDVFESKESLESIRSRVMERCQRTLRDAGYTFSAEVTTAVQLSPVDVRLISNAPEAVREGRQEAPPSV